MTRAAVISDTHDMLRPEMLARLSGCDCIIHAGDFSSPKILEKLQEYAPVYAVQGNNDWGWPSPLPERLQFRIEEVSFTLIHNRARLLGGFTDSSVIIFGHTHKYSEMEAAGRLWLNPGSCGRQRTERPPTMAILTVEGSTYQVERIEL